MAPHDRGTAPTGTAGCEDCGRLYTDGGFPDLIIPYDAWKRISPTGDDGGLLCPSCICKRLHDAGIKCEGAFMSGPIISVSQPTMFALRRVENIELAIQGRDNSWSAVRDLVRRPGDTLSDLSAPVALAALKAARGLIEQLAGKVKLHEEQEVLDQIDAVLGESA